MIQNSFKSFNASVSTYAALFEKSAALMFEIIPESLEDGGSGTSCDEEIVPRPGREYAEEGVKADCCRTKREDRNFYSDLQAHRRGKITTLRHLKGCIDLQNLQCANP